MTDAVRKSLRMADTLPIVKKKQEILEKLRKNRVLIISGDTGCGKTTQVPKYIIQQAQS
jgi:HrpA-like RNA helicase